KSSTQDQLGGEPIVNPRDDTVGMKIVTIFVARGISVANGEEAIGKQAQSAERVRRIRARGRGGVTDGRERPQGSHQGARQRGILGIQPQSLNVNARRSPAQSRETPSYRLRRGIISAPPLCGGFFGGYLPQHWVLLSCCQIVAAVD